MSNPKFVSILHRKLKPNCDYNDFYQAWLPPGLNKKDPTKEAVEYFKAPVQVINAVNVADLTDIISIGLVWATQEEIEADIERTKMIEAQRHEQICKIADKSQETKFYLVKDVNLLGTSFCEKKK